MTNASLAQALLTATSGSASSIGKSGTYSTGSYLDLWCVFQNASNTISSIAGGSLTWTVDAVVNLITDSTDGWRLTHYTSSKIASGGTFTTTANFNATAGFSGLAIAEVANSSGLLNTNGQLQTTPGTGNNGITSGAISIAGSVPCLVLGLCANATGNGSTTSAGTTFGYTDGGVIWGGLNTNFGHFESVQLTGTASASADFTAGVSSRRMTYGSVWAGLNPILFRKSLSRIGTRVGARQLQAA